MSVVCGEEIMASDANVAGLGSIQNCKKNATNLIPDDASPLPSDYKSFHSCYSISHSQENPKKKSKLEDTFNSDIAASRAASASYEPAADQEVLKAPQKINRQGGRGIPLSSLLHMTQDCPSTPPVEASDHHTVLVRLPLVPNQ
ncbi:hypothetical protein FHG87_025048, partial [Trinorchestia longiramus]